jgi:hypothetical protein
LESGELLILACKSLEPPNIWEGFAAQTISSPTSPEVDAVRRCYEVEAEEDPEKKQEMLQQLLEEGGDLDGGYAVDAIAGRALVPREVGVDMLAKAIASPKTSQETKLDLAGCMIEEPFFKERKGADAVNQKSLAAIARGQAAETDPERQRGWTDLVSAIVLSEFSENEAKAQAVRKALIQAVDPEASRRVLGILFEQVQQSSSGEREIAQNLLTAWKNATGS